MERGKYKTPSRMASAGCQRAGTAWLRTVPAWPVVASLSASIHSLHISFPFLGMGQAARKGACLGLASGVQNRYSQLRAPASRELPGPGSAQHELVLVYP